MKQTIYLDNAATTKTRPEAVEAMLPYFTELYDNPSSVYEFSTPYKKAITRARETIVDSLGAKSNEIYSTAGGTESDNWAIKTMVEAYQGKGNHIITSKIEHRAMPHTCEYLEKCGFEVAYLGADENGTVELEGLKKAIQPIAILISIMFANNEIGTIQPTKGVGTVIKEHGILFRTDAVQAYCHMPISIDDYNIGMLSSSKHEISGLKGIGFLYIRTGIRARSFIHDGAQERKRRGGTEGVPGIVGCGKAAGMALATIEKRAKRGSELRDYLIKRIMTEIPYTRINSHRTNRLNNSMNVTFQLIEGESLLIKLDMAGICGSSGSTCTPGSLDPSHVLLAIGLSHEVVHGSLRLTLNKEDTEKEMDYVMEQMKGTVSRLHEMSPLYEDFLRHQRR